MRYTRRLARNPGGRFATAIIAFAVIGYPLASHIGTASLERIAPLVDYFRPANATDAAACRSQYFGTVSPAYVRKATEQRTTTICYRAFSLGYSGMTRTPLWAAEKVTAANVSRSRELARIDDFHADEHLPGRDRATLDDYRGSGFDRGHMAPSGDMPTPEAQAESFTLANMVPQDHAMNTHLWSDIERAVRHLARRHATVYVVTGPIFEGNQLDSLNGRVAVPTSIYKAVLIPGQGAAAYVAANDTRRKLAIVSVAQLAQMTGVDPFPGADAQTKARAIELPAPTAYPRRSNWRN